MVCRSASSRCCILLLEKKWSPKELVITADFNEHEIIADVELLEQVWLNLLDNAVKFSPHGGSVGVNVRRAEDMLEVSIENHGPQIPPEQISRIYDKFWQGDHSHSMDGNGIGLSVSKRIVELHKGEIRVESDQDATRFTVILPFEN